MELGTGGVRFQGRCVSTRWVSPQPLFRSSLHSFPPTTTRVRVLTDSSLGQLEVSARQTRESTTAWPKPPHRHAQQEANARWTPHSSHPLAAHKVLCSLKRKPCMMGKVSTPSGTPQVSLHVKASTKSVQSLQGSKGRRGRVFERVGGLLASYLGVEMLDAYSPV